jgi:hypothetical protein
VQFKKVFIKLVTDVAELNSPEGMAVKCVEPKALIKVVQPLKKTELLAAVIVVRPEPLQVNEVHPILPHDDIVLNSDLLVKSIFGQVPSIDIV